MRPLAESASACSERSAALCGARAQAASNVATSVLSWFELEALPTVDAAARRHMMSSAWRREACCSSAAHARSPASLSLSAPTPAAST
jgi:hypothetical protein